MDIFSILLCVSTKDGTGYKIRSLQQRICRLLVKSAFWSSPEGGSTYFTLSQFTNRMIDLKIGKEFLFRLIRRPKVN